MLFPDKKSPLVRLSDALKCGLETCADTTRSITALYEEHRGPFETLRRLAADKADDDELKRIAAEIPEEIVWRGVQLQGQLHSHALAVLLNCCFCLEAYANTFTYYLFGEADYLDLLSKGHTASTDSLTQSFEDMSVRDKWQRLAALGPGAGFDQGKDPYQGFNILFRFRDDCVHGKVRDFAEDIGPKRYGGRLPDPVTGSLTLGHALFGADIYWSMVLELHRLLSTDPSQFQRHYNLSPWTDETARKELSRIASRYNKVSVYSRLGT